MVKVALSPLEPPEGLAGKSSGQLIQPSRHFDRYTSFIIMMVIKLEGLNEQEAPHRYEALIGMMVPLIMGLLPVGSGMSLHVSAEQSSFHYRRKRQHN